MNDAAGHEGGPPASATTANPVAVEAKIAARAVVASVAGTLADGTAYQLVLSAAASRYSLAAFAGAVVGGLTNFLLGRYWAFPPAGRRLAPQMGLYALGSLLTYFALSATLFVLIEKGGMNERLAWVPGKVVAWIVVSYPFQRWVVFRGAPR